MRHRTGSRITETIRYANGDTMESELDLARRYLKSSTALREALSIPSGAVLEAAPLGQGEHNANYWFAHPETNAKYVLRINYTSQLGLEDQVMYEYNALRMLEPSRRAPCAYHVDNSRALTDHGVLVIEYCAGRHLDFSKPRDIEKAACLLADVHSVAVGASAPLIRPRDPLRKQFEECERLFSAYRSSAYEEARVTAYVEGFFEKAEQVLSTELDANDCNRIINTEAVSAHFLIPEDGSAGHIVDWEKPIIGEAAQDIAYFLAPTTTIWDSDFLFDAPGREAFVQAYWRAVDGRFARGSFDERFEAYLRTNCLRGITWSCAAWAEYHDPARPLKNEKTLRKLGVYLSDEFLSLMQREHFS